MSDEQFIQLITLLTDIRDLLQRSENRELENRADFEEKMLELLREQWDKGREMVAQEKLLASERNRSNQ